MKNKDLFNAIHNIDEEYIVNAWKNTEPEKPTIIRAEKTPFWKISLGIAAAVAVTIAVTLGLRLGMEKIPPVYSDSSSSSSSDSMSSSSTDSTSSDILTDPPPVERDYIVRYEDLGYYRDNHDEDFFKYLDWYFALTSSERSSMSTAPVKPAPDVYFFKDRPYDVKTISKSTAAWLDWYLVLGEEMDANVPSELDPEKHTGNFDEKLPFELVGPDNVPLTYGDLDYATITDEEGKTLTIGELENWSQITINNFAYLAEPGSNEFKRYYIGDEIGSLTFSTAEATFKRYKYSYPDTKELVNMYIGGSAGFEGNTGIDVIAQKSGVNWYKCITESLPTIEIDLNAGGRNTPKRITFADYEANPWIGLNGEIINLCDMLTDNQGKLVRDVNIYDVHLNWSDPGLTHFNSPDEVGQVFWARAIGNTYSQTAAWESGLVPPSEYVPDDFEFVGEFDILAKNGSAVYAVGDGEVLTPANNSFVIIQHEDGIYTLSEGLISTVKKGDTVKAGDVIGYTVKRLRGDPGVYDSVVHYEFRSAPYSTFSGF